MASRHNARVKQAAEEGGVGKFLYDYIGKPIGKPFLDMDEGYSGRIQGNINDPESQRNVLEAAPLRDIMRDYRDRDARIKKAEEYYKDRPEGHGSAIDFNAHRFQNMMNAGLFGAANMGVRYGLPAAGVTLAGKGLYDLTIAFGGGADYQEQGQLPLA
jgi:hypothetical protein